MGYDRGLHEIGDGLFAWLQPDGGWGWSNAGLITAGTPGDGGAALVDTLFDTALTAEMLAGMERATGFGAQRIGKVVNTHANGDHTHGNHLLPQAEIIASEASAREMEAFSPALLAQMKAAGAGGHMGVAGTYFAEIFAPFDFAGVIERPPTRTFCGHETLDVAGRAVELIEVGPAHTAGDVLVHVPGAHAVFTGDILFIEGTPIMWAGPVSNWIAACDRIIAMDVDVIVPGHGPLTDKSGVREVADYLGYIHREARARYDAGLTAADAARDIGLGRYASWKDAERIAVNVDTLYREYSGDQTPPDVVRLFGLMGQLYYDRRGHG
ncbi:MBL fold metallo-hydrolase [Sandarakinorhabdus sp.]|uniref:MBL fold metallo-hydrolase n=1 Tax=Sandarakinorhabdus sp. TaxID=1916663 RepID=UPI003341C14C